MVVDGLPSIVDHVDDEPRALEQFSKLAREREMTQATDTINQRYGDRTLHSAHTLGTGMYVKQKIPFGSTRYL